MLKMMQVSSLRFYSIGMALIVCFRYTNTLSLITWRKLSNVFSAPLPVFLVASIPDDSSFETLSTFQDSVCPRCTCIHRGSRRLECSIISTSSLDQFYGSQPGRTRFLGTAVATFCCEAFYKKVQYLQF
jgi:hypothetical protein